MVMTSRVSDTVEEKIHYVRVCKQKLSPVVNSTCPFPENVLGRQV